METVRPIDTLLAFKAIGLVAGLSGADRRVACAIVDHFSREDGQCDPGIERLVDLLGFSRRTILRAVDSLDEQGLILKDRHGGLSLRNSYEPVWAKFREILSDWQVQFAGSSSPSRVTNLAAHRGQKSHLGGDEPVTQTFHENLLNEPVPSGADFGKRPAPRGGEEVKEGWPTEEKGRKSRPFQSQPRSQGFSPSSSEARRTAALRRWSDDVRRLYSKDINVYAALIEAIDPDLEKATTDAEVRSTGAGVPFLLRELRKRGPQPPQPIRTTQGGRGS